MKYKIVSPDNDVVGYITADERADEWELEILEGHPRYPLMLKLLEEQGKTHVTGNLIRMFMADRVFPPDRQNISMILRDMGLKEYSILKQIEIMHGRCDRDDFTIERIDS